ncbi:hypothetical protein LX36DRAFT_158960 [Colletotrichum falcatum]|nr:hypothetical protein LX36DRAFT_158960 [Colletotrichum falcatum]
MASPLSWWVRSAWRFLWSIVPHLTRLGRTNAGAVLLSFFYSSCFRHSSACERATMLNFTTSGGFALKADHHQRILLCRHLAVRIANTRTQG